ncbi:BCD family MFS transporter [Methyloversatilis thermotolerans]|uniref:BCD family MFS transporter n=1 Tax=Methyloversatilis thermotolerans TaxID=1346290 RepID=UPI0003670F5E|nr:BCD family MFS transporter [Methyloversatilis thermotolerans]
MTAGHAHSPVNRVARLWLGVSTRFLPFADAASDQLPLGRLLRLSLFQVSVGMCTVLLIGTLNRVMIVEMGLAATLVAVMVSLPLLFSPFRALLGYRSDTHRSALGWRRVPYLWMGSLLQFGGLAIMPFALILLSGDSQGPAWVGQAGAALAFLLVGAGMQTVQTAGLALAGDLAPAENRPRVVALMYLMLLVGMVGSGLVFGWLLSDFSPLRLIKVVQGAALLTMALNIAALWKQEPRGRTVDDSPPLPFRTMWSQFATHARAVRYLLALGLGTAAFSMQDIILEPYGAEVLHMGVGSTTALTALMAVGALLAFALAAHALASGVHACRVAALGALTGIVAFSAVVFAEPMHSTALFRAGVGLIGFGGGLFSVGMLTAAMGLEDGGLHGLALGAWGAVHASTTGLAIALGGTLRDAVSALAMTGALGTALESPATGYSFVYHIEIYMLFACLVALGPLVRSTPPASARTGAKFGLADLPG